MGVIPLLFCTTPNNTSSTTHGCYARSEKLSPTRSAKAPPGSERELVEYRLLVGNNAMLWKHGHTVANLKSGRIDSARVGIVH